MELLDLREDAMVRSAEGKALGEIERYVIDPSSRQVTHLVVKAGVIFTEHKLVPVDQIDHIGEEGPVLVPGIDPDDLEPYEIDHYVPVDEVTRNGMDPRMGRASIWRYPTIATGFYPAYPGAPIPYRIEGEETTVREVNVPPDRSVIDEDTPVLAAEGDSVGTVREVAIDGDGNLSHLVVAFDAFEGDRVVPGHWIETIDDERIRLAVATPALERLELARG